MKISKIEIYTPDRKAQFMLSNAVDGDDCEAAVAEVRKLGLDLADILHQKPPRRRHEPLRHKSL